MTPEPQDVKPLPCPLCGGACRYISMDGWSRVTCDGEKGCMLMSGMYESKAEAVAAWNRRAPSPSTGVASSRKIERADVLEVVTTWFSTKNKFPHGSHADSCPTCGSLADAIMALCGDAHGGGTSDDKRDAERYRFLRDNDLGFRVVDGNAGWFKREQMARLDADLDKAMHSEGSSGAPST